MTRDIKKILLLRADRIGDMFCTTPAFRALRKAYPDARIDLLASPGNRAVVVKNPDIDNLYVFPVKQPWKWLYHFLKLRFAGYDLVINFNGESSTTSRLAKFINAPRLVGTWTRKTEKYYPETVRITAGMHTIEHMLAVTEAVGAPSDDVSMVFPVAEESIEWAKARYPRRDTKKRVAIFIGNAKKKDTRWQEGKFVELTERIVQRGDTEVYIVAGPGDEGLLEGFTWTDECKLYPGGTLEQLGAFLKNCDLFVTSSSGPMHLAAAVDVPMVAILADFTMERWRPMADIHSLVESGLEGVTVTNVEVDAVFEAVEGMLEK
ncbi:glycosyltransferase family 9 protein [Pseudodesulfovibrio sp. zrk46]|uniref:glycosyltransferase family 9 protein n=1 Tax=Pseudodesulfovibrio sp. zrk46 TaxID=2725288 RepID=UPI001449E4C2|nr:glycosyltransferase family 9 protein [Pseudodesulfovibrio sp. zrk46]QJB56132.1 glycosyltransferase family 9 protein [Pseudodesulfovibrio sp. zrk46]